MYSVQCIAKHIKHPTWENLCDPVNLADLLEFFSTRDFKFIGSPTRNIWEDEDFIYEATKI